MLALATVYYLFREMFDTTPFQEQAGFIQRGCITLALVLSAIALCKFLEQRELLCLMKWAVILFHFAMARVFFFDLVIHNPYWDHDQFVGAWPVINGITLTYGVSAVLSAWAIYSQTPALSVNFFIKFCYKVFGFALLFCFISFTVRQYFHGGEMFPGSYDIVEFYGYSVTWLLTGLILLTIGIRRQSKTARLASLVFMVLTVIKVFLFDASELEGLYRVFSFLGLGISLIGLSYFYTRYVFGVERLQKEV